MLNPELHLNDIDLRKWTYDMAWAMVDIERHALANMAPKDKLSEALAIAERIYTYVLNPPETKP